MAQAPGAPASSSDDAAAAASDDAPASARNRRREPRPSPIMPIPPAISPSSPRRCFLLDWRPHARSGDGSPGGDRCRGRIAGARAADERRRPLRPSLAAPPPAEPAAVARGSHAPAPAPSGSRLPASAGRPRRSPSCARRRCCTSTSSASRCCPASGTAASSPTKENNDVIPCGQQAKRVCTGMLPFFIDVQPSFGFAEHWDVAARPALRDRHATSRRRTSSRSRPASATGWIRSCRSSSSPRSRACSTPPRKTTRMSGTTTSASATRTASCSR